MSKVIVERPRIGSRLPSKKKGYRRALQRQPVDDQPGHEPMLGRWHGRQRYLNEHLGPMRRFLRSQVGRPWNKVHQDLCEHVSFDNAVQKHVLAHVFDFVTQFVDVQDGQIRGRGRWHRSLPLQSGAMYVCPSTGLLKVVHAQPPVKQRIRIQVSADTQYHLRENTWWEVQVRKLPDDPGELWDIWLERDVAKLEKAELVRVFGGELIAISKRPLRPGEVKNLASKPSRSRHKR
jgi:hypothetical protein